MIRFREVLTEAWRNTKAGVTRPIISGMLFAVTIGLLAGAQTLGLVQLNREAAQWRESGASTQIVSFSGHIDGARCEALSQVPGVAASGALRGGERLELAVLPSAVFQTHEVTPGFAEVTGLQKVGIERNGVWLSSDLANALRIQEKNSSAVDAKDGAALQVAGVYPYRDDGRLPILAYNLISPVPSTGNFDECWVEIWPESAELDALLSFPVITDNTAASDGGPKMQQLNASGGVSFNAENRLARVSSWALIAAAVAAGGVLGFSLTRVRRLELASALHAGIDKTSLCLQVVTEFVLWVSSPAALILAGLFWLSTSNNPEPPWSALFPGVRILVLACIATLMGAVAAALLLNENRLFRYFKNR